MTGKDFIINILTTGTVIILGAIIAGMISLWLLVTFV